MRPEARKTRIVAQEVEEELLVYDLERDEAHCLNQVTSRVWRHADGKTRVAAIVDAVRRESRGDIDVDVDEALVRSALQSLSDAHLLLEEVEQSGASDNQSRRELIRRVAIIGGLAAAGITSIVAPTPAEAKSVPIDPKDPILNS